jgi:hypothetical protein
MRRILPLVMALALGLVLAPPAMAGLFEDLYTDYAKDGKLDACKYTEKQLRQVQNLIPNDIEQYAPDFPAEVDAAIERRAQGGCGGGKAAPQAAVPGAPAGGPTDGGGGPAPKAKRAAPVSTPGVPQPAPTPSPEPTAAPAVATDAIPAAARLTDSGGDAPFPVLALAILGGLLALTALILGLARWFAWDPAWAVRARHATAEAGWRASSTWAEFTDFVRFGR